MGHVFDSYREAGRFWGLSANTIKNDCLGRNPEDLKRKIRFRKEEDNVQKQKKNTRTRRRSRASKS